MNSPELQLIPCDWLIVAFQGTNTELASAEQLCRLFDGAVVSRSSGVLVMEIGAYPEVIDEMLGKLHDHPVTQVWRSGLPRVSQAKPTGGPSPTFCDN